MTIFKIISRAHSESISNWLITKDATTSWTHHYAISFKYYYVKLTFHNIVHQLLMCLRQGEIFDSLHVHSKNTENRLMFDKIMMKIW